MPVTSALKRTVAMWVSRLSANVALAAVEVPRNARAIIFVFQVNMEMETQGG